MFQNFYTYLFFSAMFFAVLMANVVTIFRSPDRKENCDALLHALLIEALLVLAVLIAGIMVSNVSLPHVRNYGVFFLLSFSILLALFLLLRNLTLLLTGAVLLTLAVTFQISLKGFEPVAVGFMMDFTVLRTDDVQVIEMAEMGRDHKFMSVENDTNYPCLVEIRLSPYLFFMPSETYVFFYGFVDNPEQLDLGKIGAISIPRFLYSSRLLPSEPLPSEPLNGLFYRYTEEGWNLTGKKENISKITS